MNYETLLNYQARHEVQDEAKVMALATAMAEKGWQGPALVTLTINGGNEGWVLTGVHRLAALALIADRYVKGEYDDAAETRVEDIMEDVPTISIDIDGDEALLDALDSSDRLADYLRSVGEDDAADIVEDEGGAIAGYNNAE